MAPSVYPSLARRSRKDEGLCSPFLPNLTLTISQAGGFNAVSIYLHWGITEGKPGNLNFEGHRSVTKFLDIAQSVGILVIVRPGP
jgi:hypothetical protein